MTPRTKPKTRDALMAMYASGRINWPQFLAGQEFKRCVGQADAMGLDISSTRKRWLTKTYDLGADGLALLRDILIDGKTLREMAQVRGLTGKLGADYVSKRLREALRALAITHGFAALADPMA
jgi:hypothetical protein